jgi:ATP-dependent helicase/nuclease subunit B
LLLPVGWPANPVTDDTIDWCIETAVEQAAGECETLQRTGHYLLWELAKAQIVDLITAAVDADTLAQADEPFTPIAFEVDAQGVVAEVPGWPMPLKVRGRIDRVDRHRESGALRIIDYKLKIGKSITAEDRQLVQSAVRGYRLQPPLYARFRLPDYGTIREVQLFFLAPHWSNPIARSTFDCAVWSSEAGSMLRNTVRRLITDIQNGRFFILPDSYCDTCEFRVACRREHSPTWWRASRAAESKALAALRTLQVNQ